MNIKESLTQYTHSQWCDVAIWLLTNEPHGLLADSTLSDFHWRRLIESSDDVEGYLRKHESEYSGMWYEYARRQTHPAFRAIILGVIDPHKRLEAIGQVADQFAMRERHMYLGRRLTWYGSGENDNVQNAIEEAYNDFATAYQLFIRELP